MLSAPELPDVSSLPNPVRMSPVAKKFIDSLPKDMPPLYTLTPDQARQFLVDVQDMYPIANRDDVTCQDVILSCNKGNDISLRIVRPVIAGCNSQKQKQQILPVVLYVHGGGWMIGDKHTFSNLLQTLAVESQCAIVFVDYDRSPEAEYPVALEQIYSTLVFIGDSDNASKLNLDSNRIAIAGDSAGGNMATVVTMLARDRLGPKIKQQILLYPVADSHCNTHSYWKFANGPWLTRDNTLWFLQNYEPDLNTRNNPTLSPLQATVEQLCGLPPALIITGENDILRDEGEAYAHKLMAAGVEVAAFRCMGVIHDFALINALSTDPGVKFCLSMIGLKLKQVLYS